MIVGNCKNPIVAICYDFDKTLSPNDMQAQGFIQSLKIDVNDFWEESNSLAKDNGMDQNLAYMFMMSAKSHGKFYITKDKLAEYGSKISYFPGVEDWFDRINAYGEENGVQVEHYVISSGLLEMIEGTSIADKFKRIYACSFYYDADGTVVWPAQSVNYTNKTQYLFRIEKGVLDVYDQGVNDHYQDKDLRIPFRNMIYIGDSDTDVPCMKVVDEYGGYSIGVYDPETRDKSKVIKIFNDKRIRLFAPADYEDGGRLDKMVKAIIRKVAASEPVEKMMEKCREEVKHDTRTSEEKAQDNLIAKLDESDSFLRTHALIKRCREIEMKREWDPDRIQKLCSVALRNPQIEMILSDQDVAEFYRGILSGLDSKHLSDSCKSVLKILNMSGVS